MYHIILHDKKIKMKVFKKINITKPWHKEILKYEKQSLRSKKIVKTMDSYINENKYTNNFTPGPLILTGRYPNA